MTPRRLGAATVAIVLTQLGVGMVGTAAAQQPEPYRDPDFSCEFIDFGTNAPTLPAPPNDPLCVRYDKTNITVSTLGAIDFLAAEPGRVAIVAGKCQYWQQDHWIVRATPDTTPIVEWEGSYWYDGKAGSAAGILRNLRVGGQPADGEAFANTVSALFGEEAGDQLRPFAAEGGGGGASFALPPEVMAELAQACAAQNGSGPNGSGNGPDANGSGGGTGTAPGSTSTGAVTAPGAGGLRAGGRLAATGSTARPALAAGFTVIALALTGLAAGRAGVPASTPDRERL